MNIKARYRDLLKAGENGKFFTVKFTKRSTGEVRVMNCRLNVTKHLKGGEKAYDDTVHRLLTVYDIKAQGYRCIPLESLIEINGAPVSA